MCRVRVWVETRGYRPRARTANVCDCAFRAFSVSRIAVLANTASSYIGKERAQRVLRVALERVGLGPSLRRGAVSDGAQHGANMNLCIKLSTF